MRQFITMAFSLFLVFSNAAEAQPSSPANFHWPGSTPKASSASDNPVRATPSDESKTNVAAPIKSFPAPVVAPTPSYKWPLASNVDYLTKKQMESQGIPGVSLAVVQDGKLVYAAGYGMANRVLKITVNDKTIFNLASVSKPLTAVAALQLAERGQLDLKAPVQQYVPTFPQKQWTVTSHQLLSHLGGIRHYRGNESKSTQRYNDVITPLDIFKTDSLVHQPGTAYLYSSYGFNLLGAVVQGASGVSFLDYMNSNISRPAGMNDLRIVNATVDIPHQAVGYMKLPTGQTVETALIDATNKIPSGGFLASASDVALFTTALLNNKLLTKQTRSAMWQKQKLVDGHSINYGLGWSLSQWRSNPLAFHTGSQPGFSTVLYVLPNRNFGVIVLSNLDHADVVKLAEEITNTVFLSTLDGAVSSRLTWK